MNNSKSVFCVLILAVQEESQICKLDSCDLHSVFVDVYSLLLKD